MDYLSEALGFKETNQHFLGGIFGAAITVFSFLFQGAPGSQIEPQSNRGEMWRNYSFQTAHMTTALV